MKGDGLVEIYKQMHEIDVDKEGVKGAKNFFEAKVWTIRRVIIFSPLKIRNDWRMALLKRTCSNAKDIQSMHRCMHVI